MTLGKLIAKGVKWLLKHPEVVQAVTAAILERKKSEPKPQ